MATVSHHARKVIKVGHSFAVIIPPHVLAHLGVEEGDYLVWDISAKFFGVLSRASAPPYVTDPDRFQPAHPPPG